MFGRILGVLGLLCVATAASAQTDLVQKGEYLARAGDCVACHSVPDGKPFAGGLKMGTPLGAIFSTNITPDPETGIGQYTLADFEAAIRKGVAKDGHRLYPAMPYTSYAKVTDDDIAALYAYFMKGVAPVRQANAPNEISWPLSIRWPLAIWNALFFDANVYQPKPGFDATWNRGAYLVQGLGHCGACHTPRGLAVQEKALDESDARFLGGALLDGWTAASLRGDPNAGLGRWSEADIVAFLRDGRNVHATVFGSMLDAYNNSTQFLTGEDLAAIARYLKSLPGPDAGTRPVYVYNSTTADAFRRRDTPSAGGAVYLKQCASCHGLDGAGRGVQIPPLAGNPTVLDDDASSLVNLILNGAGRIVTRGVPDSYRMTPFRVLLTDQQIADVTNFMRNAWGNRAPEVAAKDVSSLRASTDPTSDRVVVLKMR